MKTEYISLIAGFVGTILGALVSLATVWLQQRAQEKRDRAKLSFDAAVKDFESAEKYAEFMAKHGQPVITHELGYYIVLHAKLWEHLVSGRYITKDQWVAAHKQAIEISDAADEFNKRRRGAQL